MKFTALIGALVALLAGVSLAQEKATPILPPGIAWMPDYVMALARAKAEKKPIMVMFTMVDEPANQAIAKNHLKDPDIIGFSRKFVCLLAYTGFLESVKGIRFDGTEGKVSKRYGSVTSGECNLVDMRARLELTSSPVVSAPQFIFLGSDGETVLLRHVWMLPKGALLKKMKLAFAFSDPQNAPAGFKKHRDRMTTLLKEANGNHLPRRRTALQTLAKVDDPRVVEFLIKQTNPDVKSIRRLEALFYMGERGNAKVLPCVHATLRRKDTLTQIFAAVALEGIGMVESTPVILEVLKKCSNDRVRSNLLRSLQGCVGDGPELQKAVLKMLKSSGQLDRVTALYVASGLEIDKKLEKAILKAAKTRNTRVRCAAYYAAATLRIKKARKAFEKAVKSERGKAEQFCLWAISELGGPAYDGELDPDSEVEASMPDIKMREGELTDI